MLVGTSVTVMVSSARVGRSQITEGLAMVVPPLDATIVPRGRRTSSAWTAVVTLYLVAWSLARAAPLPRATGSIATTTSRVSMTSPSTANSVPSSNARGSKPRAFQVAVAVATPVGSSGPRRSITVHSRISAGAVSAARTVQVVAPLTVVALPPAPSGTTVRPPGADSVTSSRLPTISTVTSGSPASVKVNRDEYRIRSLSVVEVSSARAGDTATDATTARASARIGQG